MLRQFNTQLIQSSIPNPRLLWKNINSLLHRKHTTSLPSSKPKPSLADSFASFYSDKVSTRRLKLSSNPSTMPPHSNPLLLLKYCHHFLLHLLTKSLNSCMPLPINSVTSTLSHLPPKTSFCNHSFYNNNHSQSFSIYRYFPHAFQQALVTPLLKKIPR